MRLWKPTAGLLAAVLLLAAAGCDGSSGQDADGAILQIGTTDNITSFNPYLALTLQTGVAIGAVYPQLVQLDYTEADGYTVVGDFAESWEVSADGTEITFTVHDGATWSDGEPLTAEDAAWTINTTVKYQEGPTGQQAPAVEGVVEADAPDDTTVVIRYDQPHSNALTLLASGLPVLPRHVWEPEVGPDGNGLRTFQPEAGEGGLVSGGPYLLEQWEKRGTTVYRRNPDFYGPASNAEAVALTFYTNADSMLEDLTAGRLDIVEDVPTSAVDAVKGRDDLTVVESVSGLQADLFFNANPRKPRHRELLDPRVRAALALCVDRQEIIDVVFHGYAQTVETMVGSPGGEFQNTDLPERPYDCDRANQILDELGFTRGPDGVRVVPATSGPGGQPAHPMAYEAVTVGQASVYNVDRTVEIIRVGWEELGVELTQKVVGDETATWTHITGANCDPETSTGYTDWDIDVSYSVAEIDPLSTLSGELKSSWCAWNFTGSDNPDYDALYQQAAVELDPETYKQLLWRMQKLYYDAGATIHLAEQQDISAYSAAWTGHPPPEVAGYSKTYYTAPAPAR